MSESSRTDDSVPSLSSYPPTFVSLITTFINRAEEAETRAHKALVILKAKDEQLLQLQQRMELLEKIASRLEEVMVPPLELPQSPPTTAEEGSPHPRDKPSILNQKESNNPPLETLYERYPSVQQNVERMGPEIVHNCYARCQHLIDGLERSNWQLREALTTESEQRVRDHEQYVASLAAVTEAVKGLQGAQRVEDQGVRHQQEIKIKQHMTDESIGDDKKLGARPNMEVGDRHRLKTGPSMKSLPKHLVLRALQGIRFPETVLEELTSALSAAGDSVGINNARAQDNDEDSLGSQRRMALVDQRELRKTVAAADSIVNALRKRLERGAKKHKLKCSKQRLSKKSSRSSSSSYHTPQSAVSLKSRNFHRSFSSFFSNLQLKNKKLKMKYHHVLEKLKESVDLCRKLQKDIVNMTANGRQITKPLVEGSTQTDRAVSSLSISGALGGPQSSRNVNILQGRLENAAKVMAKQCSQIKELQQQLDTSCETVQSLKKRLSRAESSVAGKEMLGEASRRQMQDLETKNSSLSQEVQQLKNTVHRLKQEISSESESLKNLVHEKDIAEQKFEDLNKCMEAKLSSLSSALLQTEELSERATSELQVKLTSLRERLVSQTSEARDRLVDADSKIQELYLGIERWEKLLQTFLRLLFSLSQRTCTPELSPSSQAQAVQVASDILQLPPAQVHTILHSSRTDHHLISKWIKDCNRLIHNKVFAKNLGNFLLDAVLDAKIS